MGEEKEEVEAVEKFKWDFSIKNPYLVEPRAREVMGLLNSEWQNSSSLLIFFLELFEAPVLKALPSSEPQEGDSVTLSCQTKLSPWRSASRLLFSFYKDGRPLSVRGVSSELQIPRASEEHSGSYWCEAVTEDRRVTKQSPPLAIQVQGELV